MPFEKDDRIGLAPYPTSEAVWAKIESALCWRNETVGAAIVSPLLRLLQSMRAKVNGTTACAPSADPIRPALSPDRAVALLWRSAMVGVLLVAGLCAGAFVDQVEGTFATDETETWAQAASRAPSPGTGAANPHPSTNSGLPPSPEMN